jgi:head-tail adaptor
MDRSRRHRITIQRKIERRRNSVGEIEVEWQNVCETWAEIRHNVVTIRYQPELFPAMRVVIGNHHFYEIIGVIDRPGKTRLVELRVKETLARESMPRALWG